MLNPFNSEAIADAFTLLNSLIRPTIPESNVEEERLSIKYHTNDEDALFMIDILRIFANHVESVRKQLNDELPYSEVGASEKFSYGIKNIAAHYVEDKVTLKQLSDITKNTLERYEEVDKATECTKVLTIETLNGRLECVSNTVDLYNNSGASLVERRKMISSLRYHYSCHPTEFNRYFNLLMNMGKTDNARWKYESQQRHANEVYAKIDKMCVTAIEAIDAAMVSVVEAENPE